MSDEPLFDAFADNYEEVLNAAISASGETKEYFAEGRMKWLAQRLNARRVKVAHVLDFGCGTGGSTPFFFEFLNAESVVGIDVSSASIAVARKQHSDRRATFTLVDEHDSLGRIDLAFTNGVFHHIERHQRQEAVSHIYRSLRSGGLLAFWENNPWNPGTRYCMRVNPFDRDAQPISPNQASRLLRSIGFEVLETTYAFFFPRALRIFRPIESRLGRLAFGAQYLTLARKPFSSVTEQSGSADGIHFN